MLLAFDRAGEALDRAIEAVGEMPLPPYIAARRRADAQDREDYQTVFAARPGAVAAPTAALHFDEALLADLAARGIGQARLTLHVGAGTFLPVKVADIERHRMHAEWGEIGAEAAEAINAGEGPGDPGRHHGAAADRDRGGRAGPGGALVGGDRHLHPAGVRLPRRATG